MIPQEFNAIIETLQLQHDLTSEQMRASIGWLLSGEADAGQMRQMLELLADKGETVDELVGAAQALRDSMVSLDSKHEVVVDTCGTGGDGSKTFNISTAAAIVAAAAGVRVAKHGNRKVTSSTGSADVLSELGVHLEASPDVVQQCLDQLGICFCFAPFFHPAMKYVGPIRREIGRPTIFNRLGPLANPAKVGYQVLGVGSAELQDKLAQSLRRLGTEHSIVVRGEDGVDELSLSAPSRVLEVSPAGIEEHTWTPELFGCVTADRDSLFADDPATSAECIREVLSGERGPKRDVVVMNAAAALWIAGKHQDLRACAADVEEAIDNGRAHDLVNRLADMTSA